MTPTTYIEYGKRRTYDLLKSLGRKRWSEISGMWLIISPGPDHQQVLSVCCDSISVTTIWAYGYGLCSYLSGIIEANLRWACCSFSKVFGLEGDYRSLLVSYIWQVVLLLISGEVQNHNAGLIAQHLWKIIMEGYEKRDHLQHSQLYFGGVQDVLEISVTPIKL